MGHAYLASNVGGMHSAGTRNPGHRGNWGYTSLSRHFPKLKHTSRGTTDVPDTRKRFAGQQHM